MFVILESCIYRWNHVRSLKEASLGFLYPKTTKISLEFLIFFFADLPHPSYLLFPPYFQEGQGGRKSTLSWVGERSCRSPKFKQKFGHLQGTIPVPFCSPPL
uniref:Uncharacterized protein n=1 Tax=Sphaerodactylus townsendi TaxID=933632 RepID=A0ACB8F2G1_9SAUR